MSAPWIGILIATVAAMAVGAAWYGGLAKPWLAAAGLDADEVKEGENPLMYAVAALAHLVMAWVLSGVIFHAAGGDGVSIGDGVISAFLAWLGFAAVPLVVTHRFQMRPWSLTLIDAGHYLAVLIVQGAILGWWMSG